MAISLESIKSELCGQLCKEIGVQHYGDGPDDFRVSLPIVGRDGDHVVAYVTKALGGWRISDMGSTMMRLSYEHDLAKLLTGSRQKLFDAILAEMGIQEDDGELFVVVPLDSIARGLFLLGQGVNRVEDLGLWTRTRVESTFYEDLSTIVYRAAPGRVIPAYQVPNLPKADSYPIDYFIETGSRPLYLFGVPTREKAMLTTIILQHLREHSLHFDSIAVFSDIDQIPKADLRRLMNAANDVVPAIEDVESIERKIRDRMFA